jgi:acetylornithine deacetylase
MYEEEKNNNSLLMAPGTMPTTEFHIHTTHLEQEQLTEVYLEVLYADALNLLKELISIQSFSRQEEESADAISSFFSRRKIKHERKANNVWAYNRHYNPALPTILLNSHHDTVKPGFGWSTDPFTPIVENGKIYGLGSNDSGGSLVCLIATFIHFYEKKDLKYNLLIAATAEEEVSGINGLELVFPKFKGVEFAIIGEPTHMNLAVAEKGLMVLDCTAHGKSGHAAREEGENAIYNALADIEWFQNYKFEKTSDYLGAVKMSVTQIKAGIQHNVVPDKCEFTVDIRVNDCYRNEEILQIIKQHVSCQLRARSTRLNASFIDVNHSIVKAGLEIDRKLFGSPTTSDQALLKIPSVKIGPGDSARSHTTDEFIYLNEIKEGISIYIEMLERVID